MNNGCVEVRLHVSYAKPIYTCIELHQAALEIAGLRLDHVFAHVVQGDHVGRDSSDLQLVEDLPRDQEFVAVSQHRNSSRTIAIRRACLRHRHCCSHVGIIVVIPMMITVTL